MITTKIQADLIKAMKLKDSVRLETLRYILAQIKNKEIDKHTQLTDEEVVGVLRKQVKEIDESVTAFTKGNRADLIEAETKKRNIIAEYLPAEVSDEELKVMVKNVIESNKDSYEKNPKSIIGICMKELKQKADPARIMRALQELT